MADDPIFQMEFGKMDGDNDDVIVSLPAETGEGAVITKATEKPAPAGGGNEALEDLKSQFAGMTQRVATAERTAQDATRTAQDATQRLQSMETEVVSSQMDTVLSGIAAAQAETQSAKQAFVAAAESGDFTAQADAQERMADARARIQRLQEAKDDLEEAAKRRPDPRQQQQRQAPIVRAPVTDPVEQFTQGMSQRSAAWIKAHPECVTDAKQNARMLAAHNLALADDIAVDSDEYFRRIEEGVKVTKAAGDGRRPSSAAAPAAGAGGALNGGIEMRLTKGEATSATDGTLVWNYDDPSGKNLYKKGDPIGLAEMARRKHHGQKAGLYDKNNMEA